jgi:hypothetical protein
MKVIIFSSYRAREKLNNKLLSFFTFSHVLCKLISFCLLSTLSFKY